MKNGVNRKMTKMSLTMERSPYYIERDVETTTHNRKSLQAQVSPEVYHDFMQYVKNSDLNKSQALSDVILNFLNNKVFESKLFRNLNVILLLPKTCNPDELNEKAQVIGFIDGHELLDITISNIFYGGGIYYPLRYNFMYTLREFNEENYKGFLHYFNKLYGYYENIFFNVDNETQKEFESVKKRLSELYQDIDIDDAYFVMFTFNNYLDILRDGVYRSKSSDLEHEGVIVLFEDISNGVFARLKWSYIQDELSFSLQFEDVNDFESSIAFNLNNIEILQDFKETVQITSYPEGKLKFDRNHTLNEIKGIENEIEKLSKALQEKKEKLKDLDEEISQLDEINS